MLRWSKGNTESTPASSASANAAASATPQRAVSTLNTHGEPAPAGAPNLSQLLLSEGQVTREQIEAAMEKQRQTGRFIGEILIEDRVIEENTLISFLAKHCRIPHLSLLDYLIDKDIVALVPREICLKHRLLPIDRLGKNLTVAMVNPLDTDALLRVREACPDLRIKPILCAYKHFELVTEKLFRDSSPGGAPMMSASSFGLRLSPEEKARVDVQRKEFLAEQTAAAEAPAPVPAPEPIPQLEPEPLPVPEPEPVAAPEPEALPEETVPEAAVLEEVFASPEPAEPAPPQITPSEPHVGSDSMFNSIFSGGHEDSEDELESPSAAPAPAPPAASAPMDDGGMSSLMQEMATVMMDSMRDTYGVLARRMDLFQKLDGESVAKIFARGISEELEEGEIIFNKGDAGDCLYVILGGAVEIYNGDRVMARLERGALFGEMALLSHEPRSASARAAESTSLLALSLDTIYNVMPKEVSLQLLVNIIVTMSSRLRAANEDD
jgi:hypothetical protein